VAPWAASAAPARSVAHGETLIIDWGFEAGLHVFVRCWPGPGSGFVRFADNHKAGTTFALLAECFETSVGRQRSSWQIGWLFEGRRRGERGGAHSGVCPLRHPLRVPTRFSARRPIRSRRGCWSIWSVMPSGT
jgi:hypothetical protein